jgi:hypothetical protein
MSDYGIFTDEGLLENQFYRESAAQERRLELLQEDGEDADPDYYSVEEICSDHEDQPSNGCEECASEEEEED